MNPGRTAAKAVVTLLTTLLAILALPAPASAASSSQNYSRSIAGGYARGYVTYYSGDTSRYLINFRVGDTASDGLCIVLQQADSGYGYYNWSNVQSRCGAGTSIYGNFSYDKWYTIGGLKLRVCTTNQGRVTGCSSAQHLDNPYV